MGLFDTSNSIIKDELPLTEAFIPTRMFHRDGQKQEIADTLKPASLGRTPRNIFLYGGSGVGKTSLIKWIFTEFEKFTSKAKCIYVNCWKRPTTHSVLNEVLTTLGIFTNLRESTTRQLESLENYVKKYGKKLIIALDEIDQMQEKEILYSLTRNEYGLILISNNEFALVDLDSRIRSSLNLKSIEFPSYKVDELVDILKDRAEFAFIPRAIEEKYLRIIANESRGDARVSIDILRNAALNAENDDSSKISITHVKKAYTETISSKKKMILEKLNEDQKILYKIIEQSKNVSSADLYKKYLEERKKAKKDAITERTFRKYMNALTKQNLIKAEGDVRWRRYEII